MNEDDLSKRIVAHLNRGIDELPTQTMDGLRVARQAAIVCAREAASAKPSGRGMVTLTGHWFAMRIAVPLLIVIGTSGVAYWQLAGGPQLDHAEVEAGLLSDELPITAYLDAGFDSWLEETAQD
jgi:hypothetical protein